MDEEQILSVSKIIAAVRVVECPYCMNEHPNFIPDPRGAKQRCQECGKIFYIPSDVEIKLV